MSCPLGSSNCSGPVHLIIMIKKKDKREEITGENDVRHTRVWASDNKISLLFTYISRTTKQLNYLAYWKVRLSIFDRSVRPGGALSCHVRNRRTTRKVNPPRLSLVYQCSIFFQCP